MHSLVQRAVLFADLRGSTALYDELGNANATLLVTRLVDGISEVLPQHSGQLLKTLGDGLMAIFPDGQSAVEAAFEMHECIGRLSLKAEIPPVKSSRCLLRLHVAIAQGEVSEVGDDCFGDAVNVAARLLDHAGDDETLVTDEVISGLDQRLRSRFRHLDWIHLRGRAEPVLVYLSGGSRADGGPDTVHESAELQADPNALRLSWMGERRLFRLEQFPVILGRSPQAAFAVDDQRVSRLHARIDWHGGGFHLTDMSYNGTHVRFDAGTVVSLRRTTCTLFGSGEIGLSAAPGSGPLAVLAFEALHIPDDLTDGPQGQLPLQP